MLPRPDHDFPGIRHQGREEQSYFCGFVKKSQVMKLGKPLWLIRKKQEDGF